jgi:hypothetical protein
LNVMGRKQKVNNNMKWISLDRCFYIYANAYCFLSDQTIGLMHLQFLQENVTEELKEAFKVFDRNQDGYISSSEVNIIAFSLSCLCFLATEFLCERKKLHGTSLSLSFVYKLHSQIYLSFHTLLATCS